MSGRQRFLMLLLIVLAGLAVRAIHFAAIHRAAFIDFPLVADQTDMWGFWTWSGQILAGDLWGTDPWHPYYDWMAAWGTPEDWYRWWGSPLVFQSEPFYPYALAGLRALGATLPVIVWLQLVAGAVAAIPMYFLARRFTSELGAFAAAALLVLYGPLVFYQGTLLRDWLAALIDPVLLLATLAAVTCTRRRALAWAGVGAAMGAALLAKYTTLLLIVGLMGWALVAVRHDRRELLGRAAPLLLGLVLGLSPLLVRNAVVGAPLLQVCNRPIEGLIAANVADVMPLGFQVSENDAAAVLRKADGRMGTAVVEILRTYHGDVQLFLGKQWLRIRALMDPVEIPNNLSVAYGERLSPVLALLPGWGLVAPLALAGLLLALAAPRRHAPIVIYAFAVLAGAMVQFIVDRYRLGLVPLACLCAGLFVGGLQHQLRERRWQAWASGVAAVLVTAILQHVVLPLDVLRSSVSVVAHPVSYATAVEIYRQRRDFDAAHREIAQLRAVARAHPGLQAEIDGLADILEAPLPPAPARDPAGRDD
jgi:hypothetical protein